MEFYRPINCVLSLYPLSLTFLIQYQYIHIYFRIYPPVYSLLFFHFCLYFYLCTSIPFLNILHKINHSADLLFTASTPSYRCIYINFPYLTFSNHYNYFPNCFIGKLGQYQFPNATLIKKQLNLILLYPALLQNCLNIHFHRTLYPLFLNFA